MDSDGKADPYVEVSVRPGSGSRKFSTTVRPNCLNPTFNETAEISLRLHEMEGMNEAGTPKCSYFRHFAFLYAFRKRPSPEGHG